MSRMSSALTRAAHRKAPHPQLGGSRVAVTADRTRIEIVQSDAGPFVFVILQLQGTVGFAGMGVTATGQIRFFFVRLAAAASSICVNLRQSRVCVWRRMIAPNTDERFLPLNCHADRGVAVCALRINLSPGMSACERLLQLPHVSISFQIALQRIPVRQSHTLLYGGPSLGTRYIPEL